MKRDIWSNQEDARDAEIMNFVKHRPTELPIFRSRRVGKHYDAVKRYNRQLIQVFAKNGWFPFCRGWEYTTCEKYYYITYKIFKRSNIIKYYDIITCYPNTVTEYDDYYMISLYVGVLNDGEIK